MDNKIEKRPAVRQQLRPDIRALLEPTSRMNPKQRSRITLAPVSILGTKPPEDEKTRKA